MLLVALYEILKGIAALVFAGMVCFWHNNLLHEIKIFTQYLHYLIGQLFISQIDKLDVYVITL